MAEHSFTPMMRQYLALKEQYQDCLLFFRLGDFYEMFFDDAITASRELELALTGRACGAKERAPMCGVPYHSVDTYINRLISKGYKVAICEQLTDPNEKGLVERDIVRIITPGTLIEESILKENQSNYLTSLYVKNDAVGIAYCDVSVGSFIVGEITGEREIFSRILDELTRIAPTEIIANDDFFLLGGESRQIASRYYLQPYNMRGNSPERAQRYLAEHFQVQSLDSFGCGNLPFACMAAGALLDYLKSTQKNELAHIHAIKTLQWSSFMQINAATRRNLELTRPLNSEGKKNTLLYLLDKTKTAMGGRLLHEWIEQPLQDPAAIEARLDAVQELRSDRIKREELGKQLSEIYDIERLSSRIAYGTVHARDCLSLAASLKRLPQIILLLQDAQADALRDIARQLDPLEAVGDLLERAIHPDAPLSVKDGYIIRAGYNEEVDRLRDAFENGKNWIEDLAAHERETTKIKNLRVGFNRVFGYYIEVTNSYRDQVPYYYERKQTLVNAERFVTPKLKEIESAILGAEEKLKALEYKLFLEIRQTLKEQTEALQTNAALLAQADIFQSFATVASRKRYVRPTITQDGVIDIVAGRHPTVEDALKDDFIPNDCHLDMGDSRLFIITGPNMAGKSTYMRQVALIVLMAHIGCYVPAQSASITITDRIFTRIGASDDLAAGQSTFMVEMNEMANILHNATRNSLLILDEIGRGTSTFDGLSIAWAVLEYIADYEKCGAKALFATHYHELTELEGKLGGVVNYRIAVNEIGEDILFLHKIVRGGTDKSFGIQVARLAGLPDMVVTRAKEILQGLEQAQTTSTAQPAPPVEDEKLKAQRQLIADLQELALDAMTPLQAMNLLSDLQQRAVELKG